MATQVEVKERPILFSGEMVRAILDGRKTQTRRVMKPQPPPNILEHYPYPGMRGDALHFYKNPDEAFPMWAYYIICPFGKAGDLLWVRETSLAMKHEGALPYVETMYSDHEDYDICYPSKSDSFSLGWKVRPAIHMPRSESRLSLEVTNVRVERLNDISEGDGKAEGYDGRESFLAGDRAKSQDGNPWVWVIEFKKL